MITEAHLTSATSIRWGNEELRHRVPIYSLCRILKGRGVTGTLIVYGVQGTKSLIVDIDWGAAHTIHENNRGMFRVKYIKLGRNQLETGHDGD